MMDDHRLREQYEKTGNLMDLLRDPDFLREMVQAEDECMGTIGAGFPAYSYDSQPVDPEKFRLAMQEVLLQSILFTELRLLISSADLGAEMQDAAILEGRRRIRQHLKQLTIEQQSFFDALMEEDSLKLEYKPLRSQVKAKLYSLLSPNDWSAILEAATNALQNQWIECMESAKSA
jgi:hypothetical protein